MIDWHIYRMTEWDSYSGENIVYAKKAILTILKEQKVSLSKTRTLFNRILEEIEDNNPITLQLGNDECLYASEARNNARPSECY